MTSSDKDHPVQVVDGDGSTTSLRDVIAISAGGFHTCALKQNGTVWCWGSGNRGRLGNDDDSNKDHPVQVVDGDGSTTFLRDVIAISAGFTQNCVLKQDGTVWCWGYGDNGRLGNDDDSNKDHPVQVVDGDGSMTFLRNIIAISGRGTHTCALKQDGTVWCWGYGDNGSLGNDDNSDKDHPVQVVDGDGSMTFLRDVIAISAGGAHTCALKPDGTIWCWGEGTNGRLGNDDNSTKDHPVRVVDRDGRTSFFGDVTAIDTGGSHACALKSDGTLWCWGYGDNGRLGNDDDSNKDHPVQVVDGDGSTTFLGDVTATSAGDYHTCALKSDGTVWCWGYGDNGRLGNDDDSNKDHPVQVVDGDGSSSFSW